MESEFYQEIPQTNYLFIFLFILILISCSIVIYVFQDNIRSFINNIYPNKSTPASPTTASPTTASPTTASPTSGTTSSYIGSSISINTPMSSIPNIACVQSDWGICDPTTKTQSRSITTTQSGSGTACGPATQSCIP